MSEVPVWTLFAYMNGDAEGRDDERRNLAPWQLHHVLDWCVDRGYDNIYLSRDPTETTRFRVAPSPPGIVHRLSHTKRVDHGDQGDGRTAA